MTKMNIDIDEEALTELMDLLDEDDKDHVVNLALQAAASRVRIALPALDRLSDLYRSGELDLDVLENAWRRKSHSSRTPAPSTGSTGSHP